MKETVAVSSIHFPYTAESRGSSHGLANSCDVKFIVFAVSDILIDLVLVKKCLPASLRWLINLFHTFRSFSLSTTLGLRCHFFRIF